MDLKKLVLAAAAGTTLLAASVPAFADYRDHWRGPSYGWRAPHHRYYYGGYYRAPRYYMPPPVAYYTPPPYYYDAPSYYAPAAPVIYGRVPLGHHSSLGFALPLN